MFNNYPETPSDDYRVLTYSLRDIHTLLVPIIHNVHVNPRALGSDLERVLCALIQSAVNNYTYCDKAIPLNDHQYPTYVLKQYMLHEDVLLCVDMTKDILSKAIYDFLPNGKTTAPWYYRLVDNAHLLLYFHKEDLVWTPDPSENTPDLSEPEPLDDTLCPSVIW